MITVCQLIEILKGFPPHRLVLVSGYEGGFDHVYAEDVVSRRVVVYGGDAGDWWTGLFDEVRNEATAKNVLDVVVIPRRGR